jgi:hypothetical protein
MRKTVDITTLVSHANGMLAAPSPTPEKRRAVASLLERLLFDTDTYAGFTYVDAGPSGKPVSVARIKRGDYDETRRRYFVHRSLR